MTDINTNLMQNLYEVNKVLVEDISWEQDDYREDRYTTEARVQTSDGEDILEIKGQIWKSGYSFCLMYHNTVIRLWDFNDHHDDIEGGHKHKYPHWNEVDNDPYNVDHITTSDVNQAIIQFLDECSIDKNEAAIHQISDLSRYA